MWVVRQLARLLERVVVLVAVAGVIGGIAVLRSGHGMHVFRLVLIVAGGILVALGAMGSGTSYEREASMRTGWLARTWSFSLVSTPEDERQLAPGPTFAIAGAAAIVLGFFV